MAKNRTIDYGSLVRKAWGRSWSQPETAYQFGNGRDFKDDSGRGGIYTVRTDAIALETFDSSIMQYAEMLTEDGFRILIE